MNRFRGDLNPHIGFGFLQGLLNDNKLLEFQTAEAIWPGIMPKTYQFLDLVNSGVMDPVFLGKRDRLALLLNEALQAGKPLTDVERDKFRNDLRDLLQRLFETARKYFPEGAYFKNFGEFATGDYNTQVTTFSSSVKGISDQFLRRYEAILEKTSKSRVNSPERPRSSSISDQAFQSEMEENVFEMGTKFVHKLLTQPDELQMQGRVQVARTSFGYPKEYRVDFVDGEAVLARSRFSNEYMPEDLEEAKEVVNDFFKKAPKEFQYLSGGADVATLADGRKIIFEFNYGSASGTLDPDFYPIEANQYYSILKGSPTPFLKELEKVFSQGLKEQKKYLSMLNYERALERRGGKDDLSVEDVGRYFRDKYLEIWDKSGRDRGESQNTLIQLDALFEGYSSDPILRLKEGAAQYVRSKSRGNP